MNNQYLIHSHACFVEFWNHLQIALNDQYAGLNILSSYFVISWLLPMNCEPYKHEEKNYNFCPQAWIGNRK